ncbi:hypothetical protein V6N13_148461 [Hibiscus sabdariffa]|uniref:Uncharacterized protein n=1 Tax=Hibiscus sabdariffa TaxID=183260 RepID=A0ABR2TZ35_9ROSI
MGGVMLLGMVLYMMTSRTLPRLSISIWNCPSIETEVFLCYVVYRCFCFSEWSFSSGDSYEWDHFLKVGEMRSEEASKLIVQTEISSGDEVGPVAQRIRARGTDLKGKVLIPGMTRKMKREQALQSSAMGSSFPYGRVLCSPTGERSNPPSRAGLRSLLRHNVFQLSAEPLRTGGTGGTPPERGSGGTPPERGSGGPETPLKRGLGLPLNPAQVRVGSPNACVKKKVYVVIKVVVVEEVSLLVGW